MICALQKAEALTLDMYIGKWLVFLDTKPAVGGAEEIVAAMVGKLELAISKDHRGVRRQQNGAVKQPIVAAICALTRGDHHDAVRTACGNGGIQRLVIVLFQIVIGKYHKSPPYRVITIMIP